MQQAEPLHVLVVCAANQCRSRTAEELLRAALQHLPNHSVASAGVDPPGPAPMCSMAAAFVQSRGITPDATRPAVALSREALAVASLVLVADASVRSAVAALDHSARSRTFALLAAGAAARYLLEADLPRRAALAHRLGEEAVRDSDDADAPILATPLRPGHTAEWLREELAAAHGFIHSKDGWDVPDPHTARRDVHGAALTTVADAMHNVHALLEAVHQAHAEDAPDPKK